MWKVLLIISAVAIGGAGYLSYTNKGSMEAAKQAAADLKVQLERRNQEQESLKKQIAEQEEAAKKMQEEASQLSLRQVGLENQVVELENNLKVQNENLAMVKAERDSAKEKMGDVVKIGALQKEMLQYRTQIEEADIELTQARGAVASANIERDRLEKVAAELAALRVDQEAGVIRGEFQSTIKRAYNQWGFVVVNGGNDQGVVLKAQMDVYRRGQPICKLLITSVEADQSGADIIPGSLAPGQIVQEGDTVVKTVRAQAPAVVPTSQPSAAAPQTAAPATDAAPAPMPAADGDPFGGGMNAAPAAAPPAGADPFGGGGMNAAPAAPAAAPPAGADPFGGGMNAAPAAPAEGAPASNDAMGGGNAAPSAPSEAAPDPFGAAPANPANPSNTAAPDPFGGGMGEAAPATPPAPAPAPAAAAANPDPFQ